MPARLASAVLREGLLVAADDNRAVVGRELAEQDPRQFELPAAHEAVNAENLAGVHLERDVLQAAGKREPVGLQHHRPIARRRQRDIVGVAFFQRLAALADHRFDQGALAGRGRCRFRDLPAVAEDRHRVRDAQDVLDEMGNEDDAGAFIAQPSQRREQALHLRRRERRSRLVEDDDAGARRQHAGDLDQLLQADRQVAEPGIGIGVDAKFGELFTRLARHAPPLHDAEAVGRLRPEKDVLGHRQIGHDAEFLMHHGDTGRARVADRSKPGLPAIEHETARELRMHAGDDLHQRAFPRAVLADETMDLAGGEREVDPAERRDAAEGLVDLEQFENGRATLRHKALRSGSGSPSIACRRRWPWSPPDRRSRRSSGCLVRSFRPR